MSKIKNGGLDQYGAEPFEQQQFGTSGVERVKMTAANVMIVICLVCRSLCSLLREILAGSVLVPAMDVLADPVSRRLLAYILLPSL